ncbi:sensor histidine kinase [Pontibacter harenae]|uniref:sensor histidine kinase n=1 Tax=Pontibacter harenae TaxID=2894083 RepID=UPI001E52F5C6|nr:HAMP domain-containing sensor histidine kinase [Pontibacter harenae]MCC9167277.1 HAMP domain-containing histidine kinase [Pontibacter harenae]
MGFIVSPEDELAQLKQDFEEFAYIVSHDLKAPVRAINNLSMWIEEDLGDQIPEDVQQNMQLLRNRAMRMERMIEALLQFSRVNRSELEINKVDTAVLLQEVKAKLPKPDAVALEVLPSLPTFKTYGAKLERVFTHIISNAYTFAQKPVTTIQVAVKEEEGFYRFSFADNAQGMPAEALKKIFKLFYTVAPKDTVDTCGAGLAITKKIVQFVGGKIEAMQNQMGGTTLTFTWPKAL